MMLLMAKTPNTFQGTSVSLCLAFLINDHGFKVVAFVDLIASYIIPMGIILRTSLAIIRHLWCHCSQRQSKETSQMLLKSRKRITRIVFSVIIAFNVFWLPWAILQGSLLIGAIQEIGENTFVVMFILVLYSQSQRESNSIFASESVVWKWGEKNVPLWRKLETPRIEKKFSLLVVAEDISFTIKLKLCNSNKQSFSHPNSIQTF